MPSESQRPPKKGGPQSEFAWLVDDGVRPASANDVCPHWRWSRASWRPNRHQPAHLAVVAGQSLPRRYEDLRNFARACLQTAPDLGQAWVIDLFRAAGMSRDIEQALVRPPLKSRELAAQQYARLSVDQVLTPRSFSRIPFFSGSRLADFVGRRVVDGESRCLPE